MSDGRPAGRRVLVVEDNDMIRSLVVSHLTGEGFEVVESASATKAIEAADDLAPGTVDVVVCDMKLPDGSGDQVVERVRALHPGVEAVFVSGAFDPGFRHRTVPDAVFLVKPFRRHELLEAVARLLGGERASGTGHVDL